MMGHSDISVTMNTYTHLGLEEAVSETNRLQQLESARKEQAALDLPSADETQPVFCCVQGAQYGILQRRSGHGFRVVISSGFTTILLLFMAPISHKKQRKARYEF